jgi:DNA-binding beta-propeller fold protein YncE
MVQVARRFEIAGRAAVAGRFELCEFEVGEIAEVFENDVPTAELPKEGPTAHIPAMAQAFLKTNLPELKKAAATHDKAAFAEAFQHTAAACNGCHAASAKGFIEVPSVPGKGVPALDPMAEAGKAEPGKSGSEAAPRAIPFPGVTGAASLDYIAYEPSAHGRGRVWVPVGTTGSVDVLDIETGTFRKVDGWKTAEREGHGEKRVVGPSSVGIGDGFAYVGNRAVNEVCAVDLTTLVKGACLPLATAVDGVAASRATRQVWVTTPDDASVTVLDALPGGGLKVLGTVKVAGRPEGYAFDEVHGLFFTNLEDKAKTVAIDLKTRVVRSTWPNGCGEAGPRGVAVDGARQLVMVACTDHVEVLDAAHDGAPLGKLETGAGVDNIDYASGHELLYVAAGKAARLTVVHVGARGELSAVTQVATRDGARNAVVDDTGVAYVADSKGGSLVVVQAGQK